MLRRKLIIILIICVLSCLSGTVLYQYLDLKPDRTISDLDMSKTMLPNTWDCAWCENKIVVADWHYQTTDNLFWYNNDLTGPLSKDPQKDQKVIRWIDEVNENIVEVDVVDYKNPLVAQISYKLFDPRRRFKNEFWNFGYAPQDIIPVDWDWKNNTADKSDALCGAGTEEECWVWFYQARYGQYYLLIYTYQTLSYQNFEKFVKAINDQFISFLS